MECNDLEPDDSLNEEQLELVVKLSDEEIKEIDKALLENSCAYYRKVARVVGATMSNLPNIVPGIPDIFYAQRVAHLVADGKLISQGDLSRMRYSEVRLPGVEQECE